MKQVAEKENEIRMLQILCNKYAEDKRKLTARLEELENEISTAKERKTATLKNEIYLSNKTNEMYLKEMRASIDVLSKEMLLNSVSGTVLMSFFGFNVIYKEQKEMDKHLVALRRLGIEYFLELGISAQGNIKRIVNFLKRFSRVNKAELDIIKNMRTEREEIKLSISLPNEHYNKLLKAKEDLTELMKVLERTKLIEK